jgi:uncharacterized protein (TIGR03435 family)
MRLAMISLVFVGLGTLSAQTPADDPRVGPRFDVVSIKRNASPAPIQGGRSRSERPDGAVSLMNTPAMTLIAMAYPPVVPKDMIGLPEWAKTERYDFRATSTLSHATPDERARMIRAALVERFKLQAHFARHDQPIFNLVLARRDRSPGSGLSAVDMYCDQEIAERNAADARNATPPAAPRQRPDFSLPPPPCTFRTFNSVSRNLSGDKAGNMGDLLEGNGTMQGLANALRFITGRLVVDKTDLPGSYAVKLNFDMKSAMAGPSINTTPDSSSSIFTALQEQLGLKLEPSRAELDTLIIDHLEHPSED